MKRQVALITGVNGFIGSNLANALILKGFAVHGLVRKSSKIDKIKKNKKDIHIHKNDLSNVDSLKKLLKKISPDYIFHLATYENYREESKINQMIKTNIIGTNNLLMASLNIPYKCFINTGSSTEYGPKKKPIKETDMLTPNSSYAATKASATHISGVFAINNNKPIITFRLFSVYGPGEMRHRFIPTAILSILTGQKLSITKGVIRRDFIYIDDVIDAYLATTEIKKIAPGEIYNIGTGIQHSNEEVVKILEKITKKKMGISKVKFPRRIWDTDFWVADISKASKMLGWQPKINLKDGLNLTISHMEESL